MIAVAAMTRRVSPGSPAIRREVVASGSCIPGTSVASWSICFAHRLSTPQGYAGRASAIEIVRSTWIMTDPGA